MLPGSDGWNGSLVAVGICRLDVVVTPQPESAGVRELKTGGDRLGTIGVCTAEPARVVVAAVAPS